MRAAPLGFRIIGPCSAERRLVDWHAAFRAYCECDPRARVDAEAYLSAFTFGDDFAAHLRTTSSTRGFIGVCAAAWLWFDIDRDQAAGGIAAALHDARKLAVALADRFGVDDEGQLWFYSGSKGFHCGIPAALWNPPPSADFHRIARRLAETIADAAGVLIDTGVYDKVRAFRAPNSRHPATGQHKRRLTIDELMHLATDSILTLAAKPEPFELPAPADAADDFTLSATWADATERVRSEAAAAEQRRGTDGNGSSKLNRLTLEFIRGGAAVGDRHRLLYSAARNLGEFGCSAALAHALLADAALDCGLSPSDVRRQIECGIADAPKGESA